MSDRACIILFYLATALLLVAGFFVADATSMATLRPTMPGAVAQSLVIAFVLGTLATGTFAIAVRKK
jgi:hypothetical protein